MGRTSTVRSLGPDDKELKRAFLAMTKELRELRQERGRERRQQLADAPGSEATFGVLAHAWFRRIAKRRVEPRNEANYVRSLQPLWELPEAKLTKSTIEDVLFDLLAPRGYLCESTVNKIRGAGRAIVRDAQANGRWAGLNPFELVSRLKEPRTKGQALRLHELRGTLAQLRSDHRAMATVMVLTGMRPGELFALQDIDVDLKARTIHIHRSHERNKTKTGEERTIYVHRELLPVLREALALRSGPLLFPAPNGERWPRRNRLTKLLRSAMKRAGVVTGFKYCCKRCRYQRRERKRVPLEPCPECGFKLWCEPIPKALRWYDLRHTAATLYEAAECSEIVIDKMLGHTSGVRKRYRHTSKETWLRNLHRLSLGLGRR